jgi:hypothetical protein
MATLMKDSGTNHSASTLDDEQLIARSSLKETEWQCWQTELHGHGTWMSVCCGARAREQVDGKEQGQALRAGGREHATHARRLAMADRRATIRCTDPAVVDIEKQKRKVPAYAGDGIRRAAKINDEATN